MQTNDLVIQVRSHKHKNNFAIDSKSKIRLTAKPFVPKEEIIMTGAL
jgi:hypothetical protein